MPPKTKLPETGTFAAAILMHRERLNMTQGEVASLFPGYEGEPMGHRIWQEWEAGRRTPPAWARKLIIEKLSTARVKK